MEDILVAIFFLEEYVDDFSLHASPCINGLLVACRRVDDSGIVLGILIVVSHTRIEVVVESVALEDHLATLSEDHVVVSARDGVHNLVIAVAESVLLNRNEVLPLLLFTTANFMT